MQKGEIITIPYPFPDLSGYKVRPALILFESRGDVIIAFIGSQMHNLGNYDIIMQPNFINGLKKPSFIRLTKLATVDSLMVQGQIGFIDEITLSTVNNFLKKILDL